MATSLTGSGMKMSQAMSSVLARLEALIQRKRSELLIQAANSSLASCCILTARFRILLVLFSSHLSNIQINSCLHQAG